MSATVSPLPCTYDHPRPALTADLLVFVDRDDGRYLLLIRRAIEPFTGAWALPGGHVEPGETVEAAATRELAEETGLAVSDPTLVGVFSTPGRDPRGWVVSVAYRALLTFEQAQAAAAGDDAAAVGLFPLDGLPNRLAFDHAQIIEVALAALAAERERARA